LWTSATTALVRECAWLHPAATAATRKRILRTAISEVIARRDGAIIHAVLHWQGGAFRTGSKPSGEQSIFGVLRQAVVSIGDVQHHPLGLCVSHVFSNSPASSARSRQWFGLLMSASATARC
jgi:hypothetical protein